MCLCAGVAMKHEFVNTHKAKANFTFKQTFTFTCVEEMLFKEALTLFRSTTH